MGPEPWEEVTNLYNWPVGNEGAAQSGFQNLLEFFIRWYKYVGGSISVGNS